ncbi:uncharacterized protein [Gossypium hirsutum]|uniref:DNA/RNA polymerases superfamily protein n=1 Tax=Gossypium hirsutum TaxID=3635 RepID=A0A1U8PB15_GOSHI|nr:uncharacterized protein LOC107956313 [Gossypium hirsutum]
MFSEVVNSHREAVVRPRVEIVWAVVVEQWAEVLVILRRDKGSTYSYVACTVTEKLGILIENTPSGITVLSPLGQSVRVNKVFRDVPLEIQGVIFLADIMELFFRRIRPNTGHGLVIIRAKVDKEVVVIGERRNYLSNVTSALRAEKLVCKGYEAFLAYVSVLNVGDSSVKDIRTVKDFSDIFPEQLLRLHPEREVEFGIELLPGMIVVSIVPYKMALKELVELKAQIQELLDRGFIQPSMSP